MRAVSILSVCGGCMYGSPKPAASAGTKDLGLVAINPVLVTKAAKKKVFVHLMPWFETKTTNQPAGTWGIHWTMANCNPDKISPDGRRQIASYYHPLIGPYASGDKNVIEYQLLLMKLSGIDGVFIDWPGTINLYDYPRNAANTDSIIALTGKVGLNYAIVYEDQNINIAYQHHAVTDRIKAAEKDMQYMESHFFTDKNYEKFEGRPLLLVFGPQTFTRQKDWSAIFSVLKTPPAFFTLWGHAFLAGKNATGQFAWINSDNFASLEDFYAQQDSGFKIASAYPGFNPFYEKGGWSGPTFVIKDNGVRNFQATLGLALKSNADYIQIPTWNDYGEGTMIEPTREFQYNLLTALQHELGVQLNQADLEQVARLYKLRTGYANKEPVQKKLDQVFYYMVSLQMEKADNLMDSIN